VLKNQKGRSFNYEKKTLEQSNKEVLQKINKEEGRGQKKKKKIEFQLQT
jgi:hypothetical protein